VDSKGVLIAQLSDVHIAAQGHEKDKWDSAEHLSRAVEMLMGLQPAVDLVLLSGDLGCEGTVAEYRRLKSLLAPLTVPVRLMMGNHDRRQALRAVFVEHAYLGTEGFCQYVLDLGAIRLVALDSVAEGEDGGVLCDERLGWLEETLAEHPQQPTLVVVHHPPFESGLWRMDQIRLAQPERLEKVIERFSQVQRLVCGHLHHSMMVGFGGITAICCPALAYGLKFDSRPGIRLEASKQGIGFLLHEASKDGKIATRYISL
jgi:Icc protein